MRGLIVSFEGPKGSGKTTQIRLVADLLRKTGYEVDIQREDPLIGGGSSLGSHFHYFLSGLNRRDKRDNNRRLGIITLVDRDIDSWVAYLSEDLSVETGLRKDLTQLEKYLTKPDLTIYLTCPQLVRLKRIADRAGLEPDRFTETDYEERVNAFIRDRILTEPTRFRVVDCYEDKNSIPAPVLSERITKIIQEKLNWEAGIE